MSATLYFLSSAACAASRSRPAVVYFLIAIASEIHGGTFSLLSAKASLLRGFFFTEFVSSVEATFIKSFLLKNHVEVCLVIDLLSRMTTSSKTGAFSRQRIAPSSVYSVKHKQTKPPADL